MTRNRWYLVILLLVPLSPIRADQVELLNGDHYSGAVLSMSSDTVVVQSEVLGQIKLPRSKVSTITLGSAANRPATKTNSPATPSLDSSGALRQLGMHTNLVQQIRKEFLSDVGPEANGKFDDLLDQLMTGKLDVNGLRAQARSAADQIRAMKKDGGGDPSGILDTYLGILDNFVAESDPPPATAPSTNNVQGSIIIR
jgi:hypothetical protein